MAGFYWESGWDDDDVFFFGLDENELKDDERG
jgi:hypothetical protein